MKKQIAAAAFAAALAFSGDVAMGAPQPKYDVQFRKGDNIELRAYPPIAAAEITVRGAREAAANAAFMPLFRYISGDNAGKAKIEMTAPVTQTGKGQKIEMTAPVTQTSSADGEWVVRFLLPERFTASTAPAPLNPDVRIVETPAQKVVAVRFSWFATEDAIAKHEKIARDFISEKGLRVAGPAIYAFYDAPFTPPFLRRNEVLIPVAD